MTSDKDEKMKHAQALHQQGRLSEAKEHYHQILMEDSSHTTSLYLLGLVLAEEGNLAAAEECLRKCVELHADSQVMLHLASVLRKKGDLASSEKVLTELITAEPTCVAAYNNLGTVYFLQNNLQEAIASYQKAISLQANYADAYYNLALAFAKSNRRVEAVNAYEALLELHPQHVGALFQLGRWRMQESKYNLAISLFNQVLQAHPDHVESVINIGTCYLRLGELSAAKAFYLRAVVLAPDDKQVLFNLGVLSLQTGNMREALDYYAKLITLDPDNVDVHLNLGFIYLGLQNKLSALQHYEAALRFQPNNIALKHTIDILKQNKALTSSPVEYIRSLFDSYADHFDAHLIHQLHYQTPTLLANVVRTHVNESMAQWNVLDLGCGTGLAVEMYREEVGSLTGVDLSPNMLAIARDKKIYDQLIESDIISFLKNRQTTYNLIVAADTLVYFGDLQETFELILAALSSGGYFVFNVEAGEEVLANTQAPYCMATSGRFLHRKQYIATLAAQVGFTLISTDMATLRTQGGLPALGYLYLLKK